MAVQRFFNSLHAQANTRASTEWDEVPIHIWMNFSKPTLRSEYKRFLVDRRVSMHEIVGHSHRNLSDRISNHFSTQSSLACLTPIGMVHSLY